MTDDQNTGGRVYSRREFLKIAGLTGATVGLGAWLGGLLASCGRGPTGSDVAGPAPSAPSSGATSATVLATGGTEPFVTPTLPADIPGYAEVDPATGLHVTGTPQVIDPAAWRLAVRGKVVSELSLTYDQVRQLPKVTVTATTLCPGFFQDTTTWSGVPLHVVLDMAGVKPEAERIKMTGADGRSSGLPMDDARKPEAFLAHEWMGQTLPVLLGFPLRAVIPDEIGGVWIKWLVEIVVE